MMKLTEPISVMAVDEETILIVSCHASPVMTEHSFASEITAFSIKSAGIRKEAAKQYPEKNQNSYGRLTTTFLTVMISHS